MRGHLLTRALLVGLTEADLSVNGPIWWRVSPDRALQLIELGLMDAASLMLLGLKAEVNPEADIEIWKGSPTGFGSFPGPVWSLSKGILPRDRRVQASVREQA